MNPEPARPNDTIEENISIIKAKCLLGWTPKISLEEGIKKTYEDWNELEHIEILKELNVVAEEIGKDWNKNISSADVIKKDREKDGGEENANP